MRIPTRLVLLLASVPAIGVVAAPPQAPRDETAAIARTIEANYFDEERGRRIADELRAAAKRGEFDALTDPRDLAAALTSRLHPLDGHFRVGTTADARMPGTGPRQGPPPPGLAEHNPVAAAEVLGGNIGYLRLDHFADVARRDAPARQALDAALHQLSRTSAMIIDLRGGHGGSPTMVGYLVSAFVAPDADVYNVFHSRQGSHSEAPSERYAQPRTTVPLYVLTDAHDRSAAESFAYTLKNARRATLVGEATEGAANPGREFAAADGLVVFVPTASPLNPISHANWEGSGVTPNVATPAAKALDVALELAHKAAAHMPSR